MHFDQNQQSWKTQLKIVAAINNSAIFRLSREAWETISIAGVGLRYRATATDVAI